MEKKLDKDSFHTIFRDKYNSLTNLADKILGNERMAEDIVQEVFTVLWEKRTELKINNLTSYLFRSVYNKCIEHLRKQKIQTKYLEELQYESSLNSKFYDDLEEKYLLKEKIYNSLRQLPPKCRDVFVASKINGLTYVEIAEKYGISVKTVENQISTALKKLRIILANTNK